MRKILLYSLILLAFDSFGQNIDTIKIKSFFGDFTGGFSEPVVCGRWSVPITDYHSPITEFDSSLNNFI